MVWKTQLDGLPIRRARYRVFLDAVISFGAAYMRQGRHAMAPLCRRRPSLQLAASVANHMSRFPTAPPRVCITREASGGNPRENPTGKTNSMTKTEGERSSPTPKPTRNNPSTIPSLSTRIPVVGASRTRRGAPGAGACRLTIRRIGSQRKRTEKRADSSRTTLTISIQGIVRNENCYQSCEIHHEFWYEVGSILRPESPCSSMAINCFKTIFSKYSSDRRGTDTNSTYYN